MRLDQNPDPMFFSGSGFPIPWKESRLTASASLRTRRAVRRSVQIHHSRSFKNWGWNSIFNRCAGSSPHKDHIFLLVRRRSFQFPFPLSFLELPLAVGLHFWEIEICVPLPGSRRIPTLEAWPHPLSLVREWLPLACRQSLDPIDWQIRASLGIG